VALLLLLLVKFIGMMTVQTAATKMLLCVVNQLCCVTGSRCQDAAKAENNKECTEDSAACGWQAMKQQTVTLLIVNRRYLFVADPLSLNLFYCQFAL